MLEAQLSTAWSPVGWRCGCRRAQHHGRAGFGQLAGGVAAGGRRVGTRCVNSGGSVGAEARQRGAAASSVGAAVVGWLEAGWAAVVLAGPWAVVDHGCFGVAIAACCSIWEMQDK